MIESLHGQCFVLAVPTPDGTAATFAVHTVAPLTDAETAMLGDIAQAAIAYDQRVNPHGAVIQELMLVSRAAIRAMPANPALNPLKDRLRAATNAARDALRDAGAKAAS